MLRIKIIKCNLLTKILNYSLLKVKSKTQIINQSIQSKQIVQKLKKFNKNKLGLEEPYKYIIQLSTKKPLEIRGNFYKIYQLYALLSPEQISLLIKTYSIDDLDFYNNLCNHIIRFNLLDIHKQSIKNIKFLDQNELKNIQKMIRDITNCLLSKLKYNILIKRKFDQLQSRQFIQFMKKLKMYVFFIDNQQIDILITLLNIYSHTFDIITSKSLFNTQKNSITIIIQKIIRSQNSLSKQHFLSLIYFASRFGIYNFSTGLQQQTWKFILTSIPQFWYDDYTFSKGFLFSLTKTSYFTSKLKSQLIACLNKYKFTCRDAKTISSLIKSCFQAEILTKQNFEQQFQKYFVPTIVSSPDLLISLMIYFLYAEIWNIDLWKAYFKILQQNKINKFNQISFNHETQVILNTIQLLRNEIPRQIIDAYDEAIKKNNNLKKIYFRTIQQKNNQYLVLFQKNILDQKNFYQLNIQKILKQLNIQYQYQKRIFVFSIDIFIPEYNLIIEVDGPGHYIRFIESNTSILKLTSKFKKRMLAKLGYQVHRIKLEEQNRSPANYIYDLITTKRQKINKNI